MDTIETLEIELARYWAIREKNMTEELDMPFRLTIVMPDENYPRLIHFQTRENAFREFAELTSGAAYMATLEHLVWDADAGCARNLGVWKYENWTI